MRQGETLVVDGDDTLWENNVHFERAIEDFIDFLGHSTMTRAQVRAALDEVERLNISVHGYGSAAFARNLRQTYESLSEREVRHDDLGRVMGLGRRILEADLKLLPSVRETIEALTGRHRLILFTKGDLEEQRLKVQRSGLEGHFDRVIVAREKDAPAYRSLLDDLHVDPSVAWMVGNSPRSDINPALAAGLGAVYIPHPQTWRLEVDDLPQAAARFIVLERFGQLLDYF